MSKIKVKYAVIKAGQTNYVFPKRYLYIGMGLNGAWNGFGYMGGNWAMLTKAEECHWEMQKNDTSKVYCPVDIDNIDTSVFNEPEDRTILAGVSGSNLYIKYLEIQ